MEPFHNLATPREDVRSGALDKSVYAASLSDLTRHSDAGRQYWDKSEFTKLTYRTSGLDAALDDIRARLHRGEGSGFRQIESSFGGGKTHSMIAMYHMCQDWDAKAVVIDGMDLDPSTQTVWGEIEKQLDGSVSAMSGMVAPGGGAILEALGKHDRVLILIDEIAHYLDGAKGVPGAAKVGVGESNMAAQTVNFLQKLFNKVSQLPHVCVVISLPGEDQVMEGKYFAQVRRVAGRQKQVVTVASDDDRPHIIRRRLFETDEAIMDERAAKTIRQYVDECVAGHSIPQSEADSYAERFRATYPFTPDVIDVLYGRWGSYPSFQRTRGALRLLSSVVHSLLGSDRPYITLSDIDLRVDVIRNELADHAGENMKSVISSDITSEQSGAARYGDTGVRAARAIFMYSFPAEDRGATKDDIKRAAFTEQDGHHAVGDKLDALRRSLFFLKLTDDGMFRFTANENVNWILDRAKHSVNDTDAEDMERKIIEGRAGSRFRRTYVWPEHHSRIDDIPGLQLVIMKHVDYDYCKRTITNTSPKSGRVNQNALAFVLPAADGVLADSIRMLLAVRDVRGRMGASLKPIDLGVLYTKEKDANDGIDTGLREKYSEVWLPNREDVIRRCSISNIHPKEDRRPFGDVIWEKLVNEFQIAERLDPQLFSGYEGTPEDKFNQLMRTCGERRPASLDVVRVAMERQEPGEAEPEPSPDDTKKPPKPPKAEPEPSPDDVGESEETEPEPPVAGVHCTDVVDRKAVAGWAGSIFVTLGNVPTTTVRLTVDQRSENEFSVHLDMTGKIPREVADSIRESITHGGEYREDESW